MPLPSFLNGNFAQLHYTICNPVWFISLPIGNLELLFSLFFPVTIMETLNVTGLHVFYFPHFSALTNAHNLISRQVITSGKQVVKALHICTDILGGFLWWKLSQLSTLSSRLKCTMSGVGASENPMKLKQKKRNTMITQISIKSNSRLYKSSKVGLQSTSMCRPLPKCSQTKIWPIARPYF